MPRRVSVLPFVLAGFVLPAAGPGLRAYQTPASQAMSTVPTVMMLGHTYRLGSFNQKHQPTWEFVAAGETIGNWTSLITIIDRPDARTLDELGRLAEGILQNYKSHGGQILAAKPIRDKAGAIYNYLVAAFEEPGKRRYEVNFIKVALAPKNAYVVIYGARISDAGDYQRKAKNFLTQQSGPIGDALEDVVLPDMSKLPRKEF
jgi:hypothetical protein